ncbi:type ISP restriction/modification enzyme [Bacillus mojavensis]|uniref:type ISP restriction/modification enzyme n=1 Tax=Bacillus mojavensis TaxID=72360 RepID=UPI00138AF9F2
MVKWSTELKQKLAKGTRIELNDNSITISIYRPYKKKYLNYQQMLFNSLVNIRVFSIQRIRLLVVLASRDYSCLFVDKIPNLELMEKGQEFYRNDNSLTVTDAFLVDTQHKRFIKREIRTLR